MAQVAELEAGLIGERTKAALAAAKAHLASTALKHWYGRDTFYKVRAASLNPKEVGCHWKSRGPSSISSFESQEE
jgi:hypothetical protein